MIEGGIYLEGFEVRFIVLFIFIELVFLGF